MEIETRLLARQYRNNPREFLASIIESSDDAIIGKDLKGVIKSWNKGAENLYQYSAAEVIGKPIHIIVPPEKHGEVKGILRKIKTGKKIDHYHTERIRRDGKRLNISLTVSPIRNSKGVIVGASAIGRDITLRILAEKKIEEMISMRSEFLSTVSHELRTPLMCIREGIIISLDETENRLSDKQKKFLNLAFKSVDRLSLLINNILDFQKMEAGRMQLHYKQVDLCKVLEETKCTFEEVASKKGLVLQMEVPSQPVLMDCDPNLIHQVLANYLSNAIKFSINAPLLLKLQKGEGMARVSVRDYGPGIHPQDQEKLFKFFSQIASSSEPKGPGTGLGLAICKKIIEQHGGTVGVKSSYGEGALFYFELPLMQRSNRRKHE